MVARIPNDILLPAGAEPTEAASRRSRVAAFVPITIAVVGVVAILFGGVSARHADAVAQDLIDSVTTGSIPN